MGFSLGSAWRYECPRCRSSKIFDEPFDFGAPLAMPKRCAHCNQKTEPEVGFYFGAMFLSYIGSSFFLLAPTLLLVFYFKWEVMPAIAFAIFLGAISYFRFLRFARSLWLHINVGYDPTQDIKKGSVINQP